MPIIGTDEISLRILDALKDGVKLKDIPSMYPVSLDQVKRLSRYHNFLEKAKNHLYTDEINKIKKVGLKILYLSSLFKQEDWEGLSEVLSAINEDTKRDDFPLFIQALEEKRKRIQDFQQDIQSRMAVLEHREMNLHELEQRINETQAKIKEETAFLSKYPKEVQSFLIKHLGIYDDKLVLSKRLDSTWQKSLKKKDILSYNELKYVWYVNDLDRLVDDYLHRINRKKPLSTEWDYEKEKERLGTNVPSRPNYKLPNGLAVDLRSSIEEVEKKMEAIDDERKAIQKEIKELKKTSPQSFIEAVEATNTMSARELKQHGELQNKALKWLYNQDYVVASEITLPNGRRADAIGYNEQGHIVIVEVKVSTADFLQDDKWQTYLEYCDEFYFLPSVEAKRAYYKKECNGAGLLKETKNNVQIEIKHRLDHEANDREKIHFSISKVLSKKYVYGY